MYRDDNAIKYYTFDNERIQNIARVRSSLHKIGFFDEQLLEDVCTNLKETEGFGSYISSFSILSEGSNNSIKLVLRKNFFKRFDEPDQDDCLGLYGYTNQAVQIACHNALKRKNILPSSIRELDEYLMQFYDICIVNTNTIILSF